MYTLIYIHYLLIIIILRVVFVLFEDVCISIFCTMIVSFFLILQKVLEKNDAGEHFPLLAICLGFELLTMIISKVMKA